uniref:Uncharacterized protein n=1 Tax=Cacopsylla melanoneura TaxID=428564 RepID=A0A8D8V800_9HEMI
MFHVYNAQVCRDRIQTTCTHNIHPLVLGLLIVIELHLLHKIRLPRYIHVMGFVLHTCFHHWSSKMPIRTTTIDKDLSFCCHGRECCFIFHICYDYWYLLDRMFTSFFSCPFQKRFELVHTPSCHSPCHIKLFRKLDHFYNSILSCEPCGSKNQNVESVGHFT